MQSFPLCLSVGDNHSLFLCESGSVWSCGANAANQLGYSTPTRNSPLPQAIPSLQDIQMISAGASVSLFLDIHGTVWSCGSNEFGNLGRCEGEQIVDRIINLPEIQYISCGTHHSLLLDKQGSVWACGSNYGGQLGLGDIKNRQFPEKIIGLPKIQILAGGCDHSLFVDTEGGVWSCGWNNTTGQLGLGDQLNRNFPQKLKHLPPVHLVSCEGNHSLFLDIHGGVWSCGLNKYGALGLGDWVNRYIPNKIANLPEIDFIASTLSSSLFLDKEGHVWVCGNNETGQSGLGYNYEAIPFPIKIENLPEVIFLSGGGNHVLFLDRDGFVWATGNNRMQALGLTDPHFKKKAAIPERIPNLPAILTKGKRFLTTKSARNDA